MYTLQDPLATCFDYGMELRPTDRPWTPLVTPPLYGKTRVLWSFRGRIIPALGPYGSLHARTMTTLARE
eukprot:7346766-Lingulodinium_polyedra.AAC.1